MATRTMTDLIKSLGTVTDLTGLMILCANSTGIPVKVSDLTCTRGFDITSPKIMFMHPVPRDLNDANKIGFYCLGGDTLNTPENAQGGYMLMLKWDNSAAMQIVFIWQNSKIYSRMRSSTGEWRDWSLIARPITT